MSDTVRPEPVAPYLHNRFHLLALVFQRVRQLKAGARPRIEAEDHKPTRLALLEVMADTVSWSLADPPPEKGAADDAASPFEGDA